MFLLNWEWLCCVDCGLFRRLFRMRVCCGCWSGTYLCCALEESFNSLLTVSLVYMEWNVSKAKFKHKLVNGSIASATTGEMGDQSRCFPVKKVLDGHHFEIPITAFPIDLNAPHPSSPHHNVTMSQWKKHLDCEIVIPLCSVQKNARRETSKKHLASILRPCQILRMLATQNVPHFLMPRSPPPRPSSHVA